MIKIKTKEEIKIIREGGGKLARILKEIEKMVKPGVATKDLNKAAEDLVFAIGAKPSFKGYHGYPAALCVSINEEVVHALPSERILKEGDIAGLDLGIFWNGFHSDMAITAPVGRISPEAQRLIRITKKALKRGIAKARPGATFGDIGNEIQKFVESQAYSARGANGPIRGFSIVRQLCGHGIGRELHEEPDVLNYGNRGQGERIQKGMVFCIEPMISAGDWNIKKSKDGFGYVTADLSLSAHFEHTVAITAFGCEVLTET
jgi:methionyl aminopeptidase